MTLLEREPFLEDLETHAAEAAAGNGRLVVITGEAGIGKTSLVDAFRASRPDLTWLWGACDGGFTPRPLGPLYDIAGSVSPLGELISSETDRSALFSGFLQFLGTGGPTGLVIEDLHWADEATLDWLTHVSRRLAGLPALILVTYRDDEPGEDELLADVMGRLAAHTTTRRISLPRLSLEAVGQLATTTDAGGVDTLTGRRGPHAHRRDPLLRDRGPRHGRQRRAAVRRRCRPRAAPAALATGAAAPGRRCRPRPAGAGVLAGRSDGRAGSRGGRVRHLGSSGGL